MTERVVDTDGVELCLETFGDPADPAILLIGGATMSMDWWEVGFCERLAAERRFVIRYDHRDTGRSASSPAGKPSYTFNDLTSDPLRILDALGIDQAHLVGLSMGGGMAQVLAVQHPERLLTLTLVETSAAGARANDEKMPGMDPNVAASFEQPPPEPAWANRDAVIDYVVENHRPYAGSLGFDEARVRRLAGQVIDRTLDIEASLKNHWILEGEEVEFAMADIAVPTLVVHGTADPFFPFPHGRALAADIPDASLVALEGVGHEVPPPAVWEQVIDALARHTSTLTPRSTGGE